VPPRKIGAVSPAMMLQPGASFPLKNWPASFCAIGEVAAYGELRENKLAVATPIVALAIVESSASEARMSGRCATRLDGRLSGRSGGKRKIPPIRCWEFARPPGKTSDENRERVAHPCFELFFWTGGRACLRGGPIAICCASTSGRGPTRQARIAGSANRATGSSAVMMSLDSGNLPPEAPLPEIAEVIDVRGQRQIGGLNLESRIVLQRAGSLRLKRCTPTEGGPPR